MSRWSFLPKICLVAAIAAAMPLSCARRFAQDRSIVVASTTSTQDSGLFGYLLPFFKARTGIDVKVIGARHRPGARHRAPRRCRCRVRSRQGGRRKNFSPRVSASNAIRVMYNDFVLIGPQSDPAGDQRQGRVTALQTIKAKAAPFISRGDRSGTNIAELALWKAGRHRHRAGQRTGQRPLVQARSGRAWARR